MRYFLMSLLILLLCAFSTVAFSGDLPVITEITVVPTAEEAEVFREGNLTCMEARAKLQDVVESYFDLDQELADASMALAFQDEPTQLRARADFLEKVAAMGESMSYAWIDCVKACEEEAK